MKSKIFVYSVIVLALIGFSTTSFASYSKDTKSAATSSQSAFQGSSQDSIFDKVGDWFATLGKSDTEKTIILAERRAKRAAKRVGDAANKAADDLAKKFN